VRVDSEDWRRKRFIMKKVPTFCFFFAAEETWQVSNRFNPTVEWCCSLLFAVCVLCLALASQFIRSLKNIPMFGDTDIAGPWQVSFLRPSATMFRAWGSA